MSEQFVNTNNSRPGVYGETISQIQKDGVCPFCPDQLSKYHKNPIILETTYWKVTDSMYPYKPVKHHLLLIHKDHIEHASEMTPEAWGELQTIQKKMCEDRQITGGTFMMRFGDTNFTGGSVSHLHAHLIQSDPSSPDYTVKKEWSGLTARIG